MSGCQRYVLIFLGIEEIQNWNWIFEIPWICSLGTRMLISYSFPPLTVDLPELTLIGLGKHLLPGIAMTRIYHALILSCWYCWWTEYSTSWYDRYTLKSCSFTIPHGAEFRSPNSGYVSKWGTSSSPKLTDCLVLCRDSHDRVAFVYLFQTSPFWAQPCPSIPGVWDRHPLGPCPKVCKAQML